MVFSNNIPRQIALEFGYSHEAINFCLESCPNMNSGDLVEKLWSLDNGGADDINGKYNFEIYSQNESKFHVETWSDKSKLYLETWLLFIKTLCLKCGKRKRAILSLPCACFAECQSCSSENCIRCGTPIISKHLIYD